MTFGEGQPSLQTVIHRRESFGEFIRPRLNSLFLPYRDPNYSLDSILWVFMKRLNQPLSEIVTIPIERRDILFNLELENMKGPQDPNEIS